MSAEIVTECDAPGCRVTLRDNVSYDRDVARYRAGRQGWLVAARKRPGAPSWVPDYFDLCPDHWLSLGPHVINPSEPASAEPS